MLLITRNRTLRGLVQTAYTLAAVREEELLVVWNTRIHLDGNGVVMESACPIYLDKVIEQLRMFTGVRPVPPGHFLWVRSRRNPGHYWRIAKPRAATLEADPAPRGTP